MSAKKKLTPIQIFRTLVQIIFFIILPGFYASTFLSIKKIYLGIIDGNLDFTSSIPLFIEVIAIVIITLFIGRFFCGWMCAFGAVSDWLHAFSKNVLKINYKVPEKVDKLLKYFKYIYLLILVIFIWNVNVDFFDNANPWNAFGSIFTVKSIPDIASAIKYYLIGTILLILLFVASMFIERFFCRYMCPLGAIFAAVSRFKILKIKKVRDNCGACKICTNNCPMGIPMYQYDTISSGECIQCQRCTSVCPRNNTTLSIADNTVNAALAGTLAVAAMTSVYYISDALPSTASNSTSYVNTVKGQYVDGTYEGSGTGFHNGTTTVSVTVENGNITDVEILSYDDDKPYFDMAQSTVVSEIIDNQSTDVDAVSGATFSSRGIMEAVENALSNTADTSSESNSTVVDSTQTEDNSSTEDNTATESNTNYEDRSFHKDRHNFSDNSTTNNDSDITDDNSIDSNTIEDNTADNSIAGDTSTDNNSTENNTTDDNSTNDTTSTTSIAYKDGVYEGSGIGFRNSTTTVSVTVEGGVISNIEVVSYGDDRQFFTRAFSTISNDIIQSQSTNVDAVSGATYSSNGIMDAVEDALSNA